MKIHGMTGLTLEKTPHREESRTGKTGKATECFWGVLSTIVLRGGESPLQGEGIDGST